MPPERTVRRAPILGCRDIAARSERFWRRHGATVVPSLPIALDDPTVFFVNSGVTPFKPAMLAGRALRLTAVVQRCVRTNGQATGRFRFDMLTVVGLALHLRRATALTFNMLSAELGLSASRLHVVLDRGDPDLLSVVRPILPDRRIHHHPGNSAAYWTRWNFGTEALVGRGLTVLWDTRLRCSRTCRVGCDCARFMPLGNIIVIDRARSRRQYLDVGFGIERLGEALGVADADWQPTLDAIQRQLGPHISDQSPQIVRDRLDAACTIIEAGVVPDARGRGHVVRRILRGLFEAFSEAPHRAAMVLALVEVLFERAPRAAGPAILATIAQEAAVYERGLAHATIAARRYVRLHPDTEIERQRAMLRHTWGLPNRAIEALLDGHVRRSPRARAACPFRVESS